MAQEFGGQAILPQELQEMLAGRRILLTGAQNNSRKWFGEKLEELSRQADGTFIVLQEQKEAAERRNTRRRDAHSVPTDRQGQSHCGVAQVGDEAGADDYVMIFGYAEAQEEQQSVLDALIWAAQKKVRGAVLVSEDCVYGRCFGKQRELAEHELGYVCHTARDDMAAAALRAAENLAYRLAKEDELHIVIARFSGIFDDMASVLGALVNAEPGEVYNLPHDVSAAHDLLRSAAGEPLSSSELRDAVQTAGSCDRLRASAANYKLHTEADSVSGRKSVLSPIRIVTDTKKMQELIRK